MTVDQSVVKGVYDVKDIHIKCNSKCNCDNAYEPVCGANNISVRIIFLFFCIIKY